MDNSVHTGLLARVAAQARKQFGVISWDELRARGINAASVTRWVEQGVLHRVHPGVYVIGHPNLTVPGEWMAAQLWGGVLSHDTAAMVLGLEPRSGQRVHVTVPPSRSARSTLLRVHRSDVPESQIVSVGPFRSTNAARTILDIADRAWPSRLGALLDAAVAAKRYDEAEMAEVMAAAQGRRGRKRMLMALAQLEDSTIMYRSRTERRIRAQLIARGIAAPQANVVIRRSSQADIELDLYWPHALLCVELDGPQHELPFQKARDERRDAWLWAERQITTLRYPVRTVQVDDVLTEIVPILTRAA